MYGVHRTTNGDGGNSMSKTKNAAAAQPTSGLRGRRTSAGVIAQYIQDLSVSRRIRDERPEPAVLPTRVAPVRC
jgi:hypothetical protein